MRALLATATLAALTAGPVYADCSYPPPPDKLPDGSTATKEEMMAGQQAVKTYDKAINAYLACIKLEHDGAVSKIGDKPSSSRRNYVVVIGDRSSLEKSNTPGTTR